MDQIITKKSSASESLKGLVDMKKLRVEEAEFRFFSISMAAVIGYGLLIAILFDSMGMHL